MKLTGFGFSDYEQFLDAAIADGWNFLTVEDYLRTSSPEEPFVVLRHDVDRRVESTVEMARIEADRDVQSTYYFRTNTFDPDIVQSLSELGHEIGYHYEDLTKTRGDLQAAHERFSENLAKFRRHVDVRTVCSHGSPLSPYNNKDMWADGPDFEAYDLLGEAYLSIDIANQRPSGPFYLSDTGRDWDVDLPGFGRVRTTDDVIDAVQSRPCSQLYLLVHPCRWSNSRLEFLERSSWDLTAETAKLLLNQMHQLHRGQPTTSSNERTPGLRRTLQTLFTRR